MHQVALESEHVCSEAVRWDEGCRSDAMRNEFLIPLLTQLFAEQRPSTILDIGTGTGHIPRSVDGALPFRAQWTLIDINEERLKLARLLKPSEMQLETYNADISAIAATGEKHHAVMLTFTLLESDDCEGMIANAAALTATGGLLIIAVPDVWRDILDPAQEFATLGNQFVSGFVQLSKIDKFTGDPYPFNAMRTEKLISSVLKQSFALEQLEQGGPNGEVYLLVFRKLEAANAGTISA
ncbi:class I SAM-dependent methyltransferase [Sphingobium sp. TomTYG45]